MWIHLKRPSLWWFLLNLLTPKSDQHLISPYNITPEFHIKVTRIWKIQYCPLLDFISLPSHNCCTISKKEYWEEHMRHQVSHSNRAAGAIYTVVKKINNQFGCLDDKPLPVCIQIMWLKLCRNDFRRVSDRLNRCIESTSACFESPHKETTVNG